MRVRVLAFARVRELLGGGEHWVDVAGGATVDDVWRLLAESSEQLGALAESTRIARNGRVVKTRREPVAEGDELALLPPVGGG